MSNWKKLEEKTRDLASTIWSRPFTQERISGVNFDAVGRISEEEIILIEVTEEYNLEKIRSDISKIQPIKNNYLLHGVLAKAFIVLSKEPTAGMSDLGKDCKITVLCINSFTKMAFDFQSYANIRNNLAFGSAINPATGNPDTYKYIPVDYISENGRRKYQTKEIAEKLSKGDKIILLGEYGTGKSRCTKETFSSIVDNVKNGGKFALSINLREHWGATTSIEIVASHLQRIGISNAVDRTM